MIRIKRPLAWMGFSASAALLFGGWAGLQTALPLLVVGVVLLIVAAVMWLWKRVGWLWPVALAVVLAAVSLVVVETGIFARQQTYVGQTYAVTFEPTHRATSLTGTNLYIARVVEGDLPAGTRMQVWIADEQDIDLFERVTGRVEIRKTEDTYLRQAKSQGTLLTGYLNGFEHPVAVTEGNNSPASRLEGWRRSAIGVVEDYLSGDAAAIVRSLCLGDRERLRQTVSDAFRHSGTTHLLVVSGLHLSMIAGAVMSLLRLCRVGRRPAAGVALVAVVVFMALVGFTPSVLRAGFMTGVLLLGYMCKREADGLNSLGLALLLMGLVDPYMVWDVGLQLSVASVTGILLLCPLAEKSWLWRLRRHRNPVLRMLYSPLQAVVVSLAAMIFVAPLLVWYFGELSLVFLPANLLMVIPATAATVCGLVGVALGGFFPFGGRLAFFLAGSVADYLYRVAVWLSSFPWATVYARFAYVAVWAVLTGVAYALLRRHLSALRRAIFLTAAVTVLLAGSLLYPATRRDVTFCHVTRSERGMAALFQWDEGAVLVVSGPETDLMFAAVDLLQTHRVDTLSAVVFPHLNDNGLAATAALTDAAAVELAVAPSAGRYAPMLTNLFSADRLVMAEETTFRVGDDHTFTLQNGCVTAQTGQTVWQFVSAHGIPTAGQVDGLLCPLLPPADGGVTADLTVAGGEGSAPCVVLPAEESLTLFTHEAGGVFCQ